MFKSSWAQKENNRSVHKTGLLWSVDIYPVKYLIINKLKYTRREYNVHNITRRWNSHSSSVFFGYLMLGSEETGYIFESSVTVIETSHPRGNFSARKNRADPNSQ